MYGLAGEVSCGWALQGLDRHGSAWQERRVMVRLVAVLCGSLGHGLLRRGRRGKERLCRVLCGSVVLVRDWHGRIGMSRQGAVR